MLLLCIGQLPCTCLIEGLGVNSRPTAFGRKLKLFFLAPSRFPSFHLKCRAFFGVFRVGKMHSVRFFQRQVELRRLSNQLPVLGKAIIPSSNL